MVLKRRNVPFTETLKWETHFNQNWPTDPSPGDVYPGVRPPITSVQTTHSESHQWPPAAGVKDSGGNFSTAKVTVTDLDPRIFTSQRLYGSRYIGPAYPVNLTSVGTEANIAGWAPFSSDLQLMQKGTTAISKVIPTNPTADAGTFIGELKAGLPKMVGRELFKTKFKDYRKVGDEYLNVEFGWKPLISDLQSFGKAAIDSEKIIAQLHRDSGRLVRRQYSFPDEKSTEFYRWDSGQYPWIPSGTALSTHLYRAGALERTVTRTTKTWFSGAFTYHLNLGTRIQDKLDRHAAEARKLIGAELTPATVWNLAPWSWIVDWEGNIGDTLHNVSRFSQDGLVMPYGYIMQEKQVVVDFVYHGGILTHQVERPLRLQCVYTSKIRRKATPFGFGFDMTALTGRQAAILGALGLSRGPRG